MLSARAGQLLNQAKVLGSSAQRCHFLSDLGISRATSAPLASRAQDRSYNQGFLLR